MKSSYWTTRSYLKEFKQINVLSLQLKWCCTIYNNDQDLAEAFIENHEVNQKRKHAELLNVCDAPENSFETDPIEVRVSRSNVDLQNFIPNCFFCGEGDCEEKLHRRETFAVNQKVRKIAHELGNAKIMTKLSEGDMIATEAMYHAKCLVNYYNRCRHQQLNLHGWGT